MAIASSSSILRDPVDVVWNPTDLGSPPAYGGTYLGQSRDIEFIPEQILRPIFAEELGTYTDVFYCGEKVIVKMILRYPDADAIGTVAPKSISSGSSGIQWLFRPYGTTSNTRAGTSMYSGRVGKLLLAARSRTTHPFVLIRAAVPVISETARLRFSLKAEWGLEVSFYGSVDSSGRVYDHALRANLAL